MGAIEQQPDSCEVKDSDLTEDVPTGCDHSIRAAEQWDVTVVALELFPCVLLPCRHIRKMRDRKFCWRRKASAKS